MYVKIVNGTPVEYDLYRFRIDNKDTSFPTDITDELLASYDIYPVAFVEPKEDEYDKITQKLVMRDGFHLVDGKWSKIVDVIDLPVEKAIERTKTIIKDKVQQMLDLKAIEYGYDDIKSARSYAGYENKYQAEAIALAQWCSLVWEKAEELEASMTMSSIGEPTVEYVLSQLPTLGE